MDNTTIDQLLAEYASDDEKDGGVGGRGGSSSRALGSATASGGGGDGRLVDGKSIEDILREADEEETDEEQSGVYGVEMKRSIEKITCGVD